MLCRPQGLSRRQIRFLIALFAGLYPILSYLKANLRTVRKLLHRWPERRSAARKNSSCAWRLRSRASVDQRLVIREHAERRYRLENAGIAVTEAFSVASSISQRNRLSKARLIDLHPILFWHG